MENPRNLPKTYQEKYNCIYDKLFIILIKLSGVQFGRNITRTRDLKIGRARSASSITNKYDYKQKRRVSRSSITSLWQPFWNRKFSQYQYNILLIILHIVLYAKLKWCHWRPVYKEVGYPRKVR